MASTSNPTNTSIVEPTVQLKTQIFRFGSSPDFETCLTIQKTPSQNDLVELKFETTFTKAKNPQARQVKAQYFLSPNELFKLSEYIQHVLSETYGSSDWSFSVDSYGTITDQKFQPPTNRREYYDHLSDRWSESPDELLYHMQDNCEPLAWAVHNIYSTERDALIERLNDLQKKYRLAVETNSNVDQKSIKKALKAENLNLKLWPEEPEDGVESWLNNLSQSEFTEKVVPNIEQWFNEKPDIYEYDWLPEHQSPEGQAKAYFESLDGDILDQLSVVLIEGECPGNNFRAAQLTKGIEHGNHIAQKFELGIRFVKI